MCLMWEAFKRLIIELLHPSVNINQFVSAIITLCWRSARLSVFVCVVGIGACSTHASFYECDSLTPHACASTHTHIHAHTGARTHTHTHTHQECSHKTKTNVTVHLNITTHHAQQKEITASQSQLSSAVQNEECLLTTPHYTYVVMNTQYTFDTNDRLSKPDFKTRTNQSACWTRSVFQVPWPSLYSSQTLLPFSALFPLKHTPYLSPSHYWLIPKAH